MNNSNEIPGICSNIRTETHPKIYSPEGVAELRARAINYVRGTPLTAEELAELVNAGMNYTTVEFVAGNLKIPYRHWFGVRNSSETWGSDEAGQRLVTIHRDRLYIGLVQVVYAERMPLPPLGR